MNRCSPPPNSTDVCLLGWGDRNRTGLQEPEEPACSQEAAPPTPGLSTGREGGGGVCCRLGFTWSELGASMGRSNPLPQPPSSDRANPHWQLAPLPPAFLQTALGARLACISPALIAAQINPREHKCPKVEHLRLIPYLIRVNLSYDWPL